MSTKFIIAKMPDGSRYKIPMDVIAKHRKEYYLREENLHTLEAPDDELLDWAQSMIKWHHIKDHVVMLPNDDPDPEALWSVCEKSILGV